MQKRFTDLEIQAMIVPTALRWPDPTTSIAWAKLHGGVEGLRGLVRAVDENCVGIEGNQDFSGDGIARKRADLGVKALSEVANYQALALAEKAVASDIATLAKHIAQFPSPPTSMADVMLAQEIRAHAARHSSPVEFAMKAIGDPRVLGALLHAPACLSGLPRLRLASCPSEILRRDASCQKASRASAPLSPSRARQAVPPYHKPARIARPSALVLAPLAPWRTAVASDQGGELRRAVPPWPC
jgi:hypothetical protein